MFKEYLAKRFQNLQQLAAWVTWWRSHAGALPQKPPLSLSLLAFPNIFYSISSWMVLHHSLDCSISHFLPFALYLVQTIFNCQHGWKRTSTRSSFMRLLHSWKPRLSLSLSLSLSVSISVWFSRTILIVLSLTMETILVTTDGQRQLRQNWGKSGELKEQKNIVSSVAASSLLL